MNMSVMHTKQQVYDTLNRVVGKPWETEAIRKGWKNLKPGQILWLCEKCQGIPKGGHIVKICKVRVKWIEEINVAAAFFTDKNIIREGFNFIPSFFVNEILIKKCGLEHGQHVRRIRFEYPCYECGGNGFFYQKHPDCKNCRDGCSNMNGDYCDIKTKCMDCSGSGWYDPQSFLGD